MAQLFGPQADRKLRLSLLAALLVLIGLAVFGYFRVRSADYWGVGTPQPQPVAFNHAVHVKGLGMECRYCHTGAAEQAHAGMPGADTCLTCHSQIWRGVPALEPLHTAAQLDEPLAWRSVIHFPEHARFHHGAHIGAGLDCATCHGDVGSMQETVAAKRLSMDFCVDCHDDPLAGVREARRQNPGHTPMPPIMPVEVGGRNPPATHADGRDLTDCSVCHY